MTRKYYYRPYRGMNILSQALVMLGKRVGRSSGGVLLNWGGKKGPAGVQCVSSTEGRQEN